MYAIVKQDKVLEVVDQMPDFDSVDQRFMPNLAELQSFYKKIPDDLSGLVEEGWSYVDGVFHAPPSSPSPHEALLTSVRARRDWLLSSTDALMVQTDRWSSEQTSDLVTYRESLRTLPDKVPESATQSSQVPWPAWPASLDVEQPAVPDDSLLSGG